MKYLIYSDPHFCQASSIVRQRGKKYSERLHNLIRSISWAEHLAEEENCDEIICAGDFMDKPNISAEEITALQDVYFADIPHRILVGNHDSNVASLCFSSTMALNSINSDIITQPIISRVNDFVDIYYIPYITNKEDFDLSNYLRYDHKKKIVITHNDIRGIRYGKYVSESGFSIADIKEHCTLFINGHLHNGYMLDDNIVLVGNLTGLNFNENANKYDHYIYLLTINDDGTIDLEPRVNPYAFNFYKIYVNSEEDLTQLDSLKSNAVLSVICNASLLEITEDKLKSLSNVITYRLTGTYGHNDSGEDFEFTQEDHLKQFIDYVQTKIEPSKILSEELSILGGN